MSRFGRLSRGALVCALSSVAVVAAPFAVASSHRQSPTRVLLAQADGAAPSEAPAAPAAPAVQQAPAIPAVPPPPAAAQAPPPAPPAAPPPTVSQDAPAQQASESFSRAEIEKFVAPIALYPDALLAQLLAAAAYPLDVVQAARWIDRNRSAVERRDFTGVDQQRWDESVKALTRFPEVVKKLNDDVDWMTDLGEAFINQPAEVADAIQDLRDRAEAKGALKTTEQQRVARRQEGGRNYVIIEPVNPARIYVPVYDPWSLWWPSPGYVAAGPWMTWPYYGLLAGVVPAAFYWGWNSGSIYPPYWPGYRGWRPGLAYAGVGPRRWEPNPQRFRPELVSKRSNKAITHYGATHGGRQAHSNLSAQQRTQRATRELTRAGGKSQYKSQQLSRNSQTRQDAQKRSTRAQMGAGSRTRNVGAQNRATRQMTRANRGPSQRTMRSQGMRGPSMRGQSMRGPSMRSSGGRSYGGGGGRGGGRGRR
ncbi:MAG: DUF3300 domain-containing protein [Beijerinckiaceae bacterium]|nr:DUF3300 domain-containing protein [Beijerinckiaceae bacterium]